MSEIFVYLLNWFWDLLNYISSACTWLFTPLSGLETLIGVSIAPIYLIGGTALTIGIVRAIL